MKNEIWNHNLAYNSWIKKHVYNKSKILDVGCGNGYLDYYLYDGINHITGLDTDINKIKIDNKTYPNLKFIRADFINYDFKDEKYDAIIFVASIHHMNHQKAIKKAKKLLNNNGIIIIVGLAKPSSIFDWIIEIVRLIPSKLISRIKKAQTSEDLNINVNYDFPKMSDLRKLYQKELNGYKLKYGLHYRYLLYWTKK